MSATNKTLVFDPSRAAESNVPRILGLGITFYTLALVAFGLRVYTRAVIVRSFGKDDVLMILCMVRRPDMMLTHTNIPTAFRSCSRLVGWLLYWWPRHMASGDMRLPYPERTRLSTGRWSSCKLF